MVRREDGCLLHVFCMEADVADVVAWRSYALRSLLGVGYKIKIVDLIAISGHRLSNET